MFFEVIPTWRQFWSDPQNKFREKSTCCDATKSTFVLSVDVETVPHHFSVRTSFWAWKLPLQTDAITRKNLVPPSHFHPLWNISIAEAAPRQKWYGLWKMIPFFFWAQMWTQNQLRSFEGLCSWLRVFWSPEEKQLDAITRRNFKRCNKFERIPLSTVKSLAPKQNIFTPLHIFLFMPLSF